MNPFTVIIPARLGSTRLPDKPLADLLGRPLIVHVLERAMHSGASRVCVATDSEKIAETVRGHGGEAVMTSAYHRSGTDRLAEAAGQLGLEDEAVVVNLQGDEPGMPPACIRQVAQLLDSDPDASMTTLWWPVADEQEWRNANVVKLVADARGRALYFSRAPIPHWRDGDWPQEQAKRHVGLYAYRGAALTEWPCLAPSVLEQIESLEQLRALQAGWTILCEQACEPVPPGIDTPEDLAETVRALQRESG